MSDVPPLEVAHDEAPDMAAAELALGLLEGDARASAMRRVLCEPGFAHAVERWRLSLAQLFDVWPGMDAPDVLARVERSIDGVAEAPVATLLPRERAPSRFWPGLAALSSIAAAGLLIALVTRPLPLPVPPPARSATIPTLVASIDPAVRGAVPVTAIYDAQAGAIRLTQATLSPADHSAELWVIPASGTPHSLGVLRTRGTTMLMLSAANRARIAAGATLAVTLEPVGGSPCGLPTGPVVAKGAISTV